MTRLKRFELDYTTFETVKVNARQSFPTVLNMKPFSTEGIMLKEAQATAAASGGSGDTPRRTAEGLDPRFEYHLHGVLIHAGVAGGGHYYSYIRDSETGGSIVSFPFPFSLFPLSLSLSHANPHPNLTTVLQASGPNSTTTS